MSGGAVKLGPVCNKFPPAGASYQVKVTPAVLELAVKIAATPTLTVTEGGVMIGASSEPTFMVAVAAAEDTPQLFTAFTE
ncbi:hypothetical protein D3C86_1572780 [compost metagenome]